MRPTRTNAHRPPWRPQLAAPPSHQAQHQQSDPPKNSHPLSCSPCDHTLQPQKNSKRVFPSPRKFQLHTCPLMTSEMALATAQRRKNKLATLRVHHLEIMTQPALGGAPCSGPSVESKASPEALLATVSGLCLPQSLGFASHGAFLKRFAAKRRGLPGTYLTRNLRNACDRNHLSQDETAGGDPLPWAAALIPSRQPCLFLPYGRQKTHTHIDYTTPSSRSYPRYRLDPCVVVVSSSCNVLVLSHLV